MGMILVVSPGSWEYRAPQLTHAAWNGFTAADLVMPLFLFSVGLSMALGDPKAVSWQRAISRTFWLVVLGLCVNLLPSFNLDHLRIPGVLQRIAQTYFVAFIVWKLSNASPRVMLISVISLLAFNLVCMHVLDVPGIDSKETTPYANLAAYFDRAIFGVDHLWSYGTYEQMGVVYDPDGMLTGIFATANVLCGCLAGAYLNPVSNYLKTQNCVAALMIVILGLILSLITSLVIPINKSLWSISFFLLTASLSLAMLCSFALLRSLVPHRVISRLLIVLTVLGCNAILGYLISSILLAYSGTPWISGVGIQTTIFNQVSQYVSSPLLSSLICSVIVLLFIVGVLTPLHQRRIYLRL